MNTTNTCGSQCPPTSHSFKNDNDNVSTSLSPCIPKVWLRAFNLALLGTTIIIGIYAIREFNLIMSDSDPEIKREKMRLIGATVSTVGILLWPVVWDTLIGYSIITHHPLTLFGFLWPMVMNMLDLTAAATSSNAVDAEKVYGIGEITSDSNTLVGIAFAIGSFLSSQTNAKLVNATIPLLMYALLLLIAFIVPTPSLDPNDYTGFAVGTIQRTFFNYAMGFVITGISINVSGQSGRGLQRALTEICLEQQKSSKTN